jgi:hypothetical protein
MLGGETLRVWAQLRTHNRHGPRRIVQSVATVSVWDYEPLSAEYLTHFSVRQRRVTLPMAPLPDRAAAERRLAELCQRRADLVRGDASEGARNVADRLVEWGELVVRSVAAGTPITRDLEVWALRLNDVGIVAVNGEPFAELALEVKRRSPLPHTFFLGYSNGCLGYLPTPEAFAEGGMEVEESYRNYLLPVGFTREWGPAVVGNALEMLQELGER